MFVINISDWIKYLKQKDNIVIIDTQLLITNKELPIIVQKKKYFFLWEGWPLWSFLPLFFGMLSAFYYIIPLWFPEQYIYRFFIVLIRYIFTFIININLLSNSWLYKIIMFLIIFISAPYINQRIFPQEFWFRESPFYLYEFIWKYFPFYLWGLLILLITICIKSNILYKKNISQTK